jgi:hypothetical protein
MCYVLMQSIYRLETGISINFIFIKKIASKYCYDFDNFHILRLNTAFKLT